MRIGIELNGVLRDTLKKIQQEYEKWYLENPFKEDEEKSEYEVISDLTSLDISKHLKFMMAFRPYTLSPEYAIFYTRNTLWRFLVTQVQ